MKSRQRRCVLSIVGISFLSGCSEISTSLGRPTGLGSPWLLNLGVYAVVCGLLLGGIRQLLFAAGKAARNQEHLRLAIVMFGVALLLRQWLPATPFGWMLIPPLPFADRSSWWSSCLSNAAWLSGGIGMYLGLSSGKNDEHASAGAVLTIIALGCSAWLGFWKFDVLPTINEPLVAQPQAAPAPEPKPLSVDQARQFVAEWTRQREGHAQTLAAFQTERDDLVKQMRDLGVTTADSLSHNPEARVLADELVDITRQIEALTADTERLSLALVKMTSVLRRIERRQRLNASSGLSVAEHGMLEQSVRELEVTLRQPNGLPPVVEETQIKQLVDRLLSRQ